MEGVNRIELFLHQFPTFESVGRPMDSLISGDEAGL